MRERAEARSVARRCKLGERRSESRKFEALFAQALATGVDFSDSHGRGNHGALAARTARIWVGSEGMRVTRVLHVLARAA